MIGEQARYIVTNEQLAPMVLGLDLKETDCVLGIGGSGDQCLAILEFAGSVLAVDRNRHQVDLISRRVRLLERGDFDSFLYPDDNASLRPSELSLRERIDYFDQPGRLEKIRSKLGSFSIELGDVFDFAESKEFDKIYLSNSLSYCVSYHRFPDLLKVAAGKLPSGGLIYAVDRVAPVPVPGLVVDERLTQLADNRDDAWTPVVYRKI